MFRLLVAAALVPFFSGTMMAQSICPPQIRSQHTLGTGAYDEGRRILQTSDGGFVVGGSYAADSFGPGNKTSPSFGGRDFWLIRFDAQAQKLWDQSYGGMEGDWLYALEQTSDGGFILGGSSDSDDVGGNKTSPWFGSQDFWIVRTDASGNKLWDKSFGGTLRDELRALKQTADGGFILAGFSQSGVDGNKSSENLGRLDYWVVRLDANGDKLWDASYGGTENEALTAIQQTADGGFVLGGYSSSDQSWSKTAVSYGGIDFWLVRIDAQGSQIWDRAYGGEQSERLTALLTAPDGGFFLAGTSGSGISGKKTVPSFGGNDFWLVRTDPEGIIVWDGVYGGPGSEELYAAIPIGSNGLLLAGASPSPPGGSKTSQLFGSTDYWLVRLDGQGNQIWDGSFGSLGSDVAHDAVPIPDGGYMVVGNSFLTGGNQTGTGFGGDDIWLLKLLPENALDCDGDGVPNAQDLCDGTPFGTIVNTNGCSIAQICPCHEGWTEHADYVACVHAATVEFRGAGLITLEQAADLVEQADEANCPLTFVACGMVHRPIRDTVVSVQGETAHFMPGTHIVYGTSILLGEADSGVFIDPYVAGIWGSADPDWFLEGKVYGQLRGGSNSLVARVRATKPELEMYPVEIDFTSLGATNLTFQYWMNESLQREETPEDGQGPIGHLTIHSSGLLGPRVNPFWRMRDGSVGVLIEFVNEGLVFVEDETMYNRIFVRADGIVQQVDYISRVEVAAGGGLDNFSFIEERLGMFRNRHRIVSGGLFHAARGQLTVSPREDSWFGTNIEFDNTPQFEADFLPFDLTNNDASLSLFAHPDLIGGEVQSGGQIQIIRLLDKLQVFAHFLGIWDPGESNLPPPDASVEVQGFRNGILSGSCVAANSAWIGYLGASNQPAPRIIGSVVTGSFNSPPAIAFSVDQLTAFVCTNGAEILGTHFRIRPINPDNLLPDVAVLNVILNNMPAVTITDERSTNAQPRLSIATTAETITLAWPDNTRLFRLESSSSLPNGFTAVPGDPEFINNQNQVILPRETTGSRFFRLRSGAD